MHHPIVCVAVIIHVHNYVDYNNSLIIWVKSQHDLKSTKIAKLESAVHTIISVPWGYMSPLIFEFFIYM